MVAVAAVVCVSLLAVAAVAALSHQMSRLRREAARREMLLVDQICHLAGRPWNAPPAHPVEPVEETQPLLWTSPEQMPADWVGVNGNE